MEMSNNWDYLTRYNIIDYDANDFIYGKPSKNAFTPPVYAPLEEPLPRVKYPEFNKLPDNDIFSPSNPEKKSSEPNWKKLISIISLSALALAGGLKVYKWFKK